MAAPTTKRPLEGPYFSQEPPSKKGRVDKGEAAALYEFSLLSDLRKGAERTDERVSAVFKSLELPYREVRVLLNSEAFELKNAKEWDRIEGQYLAFEADPKMVESSKKFKTFAASPMLLTQKIAELNTSDPLFVSLKGLNHPNEDRFCRFSVIVELDSGLHSAECFALFDGHGGAQAADFCRDNIKDYLALCLEHFKGQDHEIANALILSFVRLDAAFKKQPVPKGINPGCTACLSLIVGEKLFVATSGDCRALYYPGSIEKSKQLTYDFKASDVYAQKNVTSRGGMIIPVKSVMRVQGSLAITRAIGDEHLRDKSGIKKITPRPKVIALDLSDVKEHTSAYLLMCTDGLTDVATTGSLLDSINSLEQAGRKPQQMAERFARAAAKAGSIDDITVGIVDLKALLAQNI